MARETKKSFCRICQAFCAIEVDVEDGRVVATRGDAADPMTGGYTCIKGRAIPEQLNDPNRLRASLRARGGGGFETIGAEQAMDEIAGKLEDIIAEHGPRAVASYSGTCCYYHSGVTPVVHAWHQGVGSPSLYSSLTIDQSAKVFAVARMGLWGGGTHSFATSDVALVVGNNPLVSHLSPPSGVPGFNPTHYLNEAKQRGLKLICVDPRRSELAKRSDIHLQITPGQDAAVLAGILRVIFEEGLHDAAFCAEHISGLEALRAAVSPFTLDHVAGRGGVGADALEQAARLFGRGPRGCATSGTGPDMGPHPSLSEHLVFVLNAVCGRVNREGEKIDNPGVLGAALPRVGQPVPSALLPPLFGYGGDPAPRVRGLQQICGEMPTAALAEEILTPGEGQVRALICVGGNPLMAWPDQAMTARALAALDLLVCVDPKLTETARMADYVIAPCMPMEREDVTLFADMFYEKPYSHYTEAVVEPDGDLIEDWRFFVGLARRMKTELALPTGAIDPAAPPSKFELLEMLTAGSRVPLSEVREKDGGYLFEEVEVLVAPPMEGLDAKLEMAPPGIVEELGVVFAEAAARAAAGVAPEAFSHLLICRRMNEVLNSVGRDLPTLSAKAPNNPAYLNAGEMSERGWSDGDLLRISSEIGEISAEVRASDEVRRGVVSMAHCWGGVPGEECDPRLAGANTNLLIATDRDFDPAIGMARQTAVPVNLSLASRRGD